MKYHFITYFFAFLLLSLSLFLLSLSLFSSLSHFSFVIIRSINDMANCRSSNQIYSWSMSLNECNLKKTQYVTKPAVKIFQMDVHPAFTLINVLLLRVTWTFTFVTVSECSRLGKCEQPICFFDFSAKECNNGNR